MRTNSVIMFLEVHSGKWNPVPKFPDFFKKIPGPIFQNSLTFPGSFQKITNLQFQIMDSQFKISRVSRNRRFSEKIWLCKFYHEYTPRKSGDFRSNTWFLSIKRNFPHFTAKCGVFGLKCDFVKFIEIPLTFSQNWQNSLTFPGCLKFPEARHPVCSTNV